MQAKGLGELCINIKTIAIVQDCSITQLAARSPSIAVGIQSVMGFISYVSSQTQV